MSDWDTRHEIPLLHTLNAEGMAPHEVHEYIPTHSVRAIKLKGLAIGLSWRRPGSTRGLIVGQPRGMSLVGNTSTDRLRDLLLANKVNPAVIRARLELARRGVEDVCPSCGHNPVAIPQESKPAADDGVCLPCHKERLLEQRRRALAEIQRVALITDEQHKEQQVVWQETSRSKRRAGR